MKQVYILTKEEMEELECIQRRIEADVSIICDLLKDESIRNDVKESVWNVLYRIDSYCSNMEDILESE